MGCSSVAHMGNKSIATKMATVRVRASVSGGCKVNPVVLSNMWSATQRNVSPVTYGGDAGRLCTSMQQVHRASGLPEHAVSGGASTACWRGGVVTDGCDCTGGCSCDRPNTYHPPQTTETMASPNKQSKTTRYVPHVRVRSDRCTDAFPVSEAESETQRIARDLFKLVDVDLRAQTLICARSRWWATFDSESLLARHCTPLSVFIRTSGAYGGECWSCE